MNEWDGGELGLERAYRLPSLRTPATRSIVCGLWLMTEVLGEELGVVEEGGRGGYY